MQANQASLEIEQFSDLNFAEFFQHNTVKIIELRVTGS